MRLFVACDLPESVHFKLDLIACGIPGARWLESHDRHLTLKFIGEVDGHVKKNIETLLSQVRHEPFSIELAGLGHFPPRKNPEILWLGVKKNPELLLLQTKIESALLRASIARDKRNFSPHITLARLKNTPPERVGAFIAEHNLIACAPFTVDSFYLYSSQLGKKHASYRKERAYPLR